MAKHRSAHIGFSLIFVLATSPIAGAADPLPQAPGFASTRLPNIVLILADDLGFSDLGCYGSEILYAEPRPAGARAGCGSRSSTIAAAAAPPARRC